MVVTFYNFSKRKNSTKQPTGTGTNIDVVLKEPTDIEAPALMLTGNTFTYNYAYIGDFGRYYFVSKITSNFNGCVRVDLIEDYGATWKTAIGSSKAMILRCSTGYNKWITDNGIQVLTTKQYNNSQSALAVDAVWSITGCYLLVVAAKGTTGADGFTIPYLIDKAGMQAVADFLFDENNEAQLKKYFETPYNCIISCKWLPFDKSQFTTSSNPVYLGGVEVKDANNNPVMGDVVTGRLRAIGATVNFPASLRFTDFRDQGPYAKCNVMLPGYGKVDIDLSNYMNDSAIQFEGVVDALTGDVTIKWENSTVSYNVAADVPIAQVSKDMSGFIGGLTAMGTGAITGAVGIATATTGAGLAVAAVTAGIGIISGTATAALSYAKESVNVKGSVGNYTNIQQYYYSYDMEYWAQDTSDPENSDYVAKYGRPLNKVDTISSHSGFILTSGASIAITGIESERDNVNTLMDSGFYYE